MHPGCGCEVPRAGLLLGRRGVAPTRPPGCAGGCCRWSGQCSAAGRAKGGSGMRFSCVSGKVTDESGQLGSSLSMSKASQPGCQ
jgi:hypothetical protein